MSSRESPCKSISILILSDEDSKLCKVSPASKLQEHKGFTQFSKLCQNLCLPRWLNPKRKQVKSFNPFWSKILKTLFCTGRINNNNLLLKTEIDLEFLILSSKLNRSLKVERKREYLKQSVRQRNIEIWMFLVLIV